MNRKDEIEARLAAIRDELEKPDANIDALTEEVRRLKNELQQINAAAEKRKKLREDVSSGLGTVIRTFKPNGSEDMPFAIDSEEYRTAWLKHMQGRDLSAVEQLIATSNRKRVYEAMQFAGLQDGIVTVSFSKKNQMYKNLAERKPEEIAEAMTAAFGQPMTVRIVDEGIAAPKAEGTSNVAKRVIEQSYDIFGRENIDLES